MNKKVKIGIISAVVIFIAFIGLAFGDDSTDKTSESTIDITASSEAVFENSTDKEKTENTEIRKETNKNSNKSTEAAKKENLQKPQAVNENGFNLNSIPKFSGRPYVVINGNKPNFNLNEKREKYYENYSPLDYLGRCTLAEASLGLETMPKEERGPIGMVKPSGWHTIKYDCVNGKYLYNRCHLIGFQLSGENANERNLITGTRYLNVDGMLPFENMVADYIKETENHVLYRVRPVFKGTELVARGVQIEAYSVEDDGDGICFNVYCYNNQPGVTIDYATGESSLNGEKVEKPTKDNSQKQKPTTTKKQQSPSKDNSKNTTVRVTSSNKKEQTYVINKKSGIFHEPSCHSANKMKDENKIVVTSTREELIKKGYKPCKNCNP